MPLRWKLVSLYGLILAAVIAGFGLLLVVRLRQALEQGVRAELEARVETIGAVVELEGDKWIVEPKSGIDEQYSAASGTWYVVQDSRGAVVLASPLARVVRGDDRRFVEIGRTITKSEKEDEPAMRGAKLTITCGKTLTNVDRAVGTLIEQLAIFGPLTLLVALLGGLWLAGRALRPIGAMAAAAAEIGAHDLSRRVPVLGRDELARLATTLNEMFARLGGAFEKQRRFVADASHELRTPLAVVTGNVELALSRPRDAEQQRVLLGDAQEAAKSMQDLIESLLALARADANGHVQKRDAVSLTALCDEVARRCRPLADERRVSIGMQGPADVVVPGERAALDKLVTNLVTNAIRYNRDGGSVTIRLARGEGHARIEVSDTGIGIPAGDLPRIFDRFYRVDEARSREAGGFGLGLAIARCVAEVHGGAIAVASEEGKGSTFTVTLPA